MQTLPFGDAIRKHAKKMGIKIIELKLSPCSVKDILGMSANTAEALASNFKTPKRRRRNRAR
jgi:hypothetical protein